MITPLANVDLHEELGKGGFGTVYRAVLRGDGGFEKIVAVKVLNPDIAKVDEIAQRLRDEGRILGLIRHRAIVKVDGLVSIDGRPGIVMEYVDGRDLANLVEYTIFPARVVLEIIREVAGALHAAYYAPADKGRLLRLLHRDIKPSNVRLTPWGEVKVLDFGVARAEFQAREAKTRDMGFGSLEYMAPERLVFEDSPAGDIYALGATAYELLAGHVFGRAAVNEHKHQRRIDGAIGALSCSDSAVAADLRALIQEMLAFDPASRPVAREVERRCDALIPLCVSASTRDWVDLVFAAIESGELTLGGAEDEHLPPEGVDERDHDPAAPADGNPRRETLIPVPDTSAAPRLPGSTDADLPSGEEAAIPHPSPSEDTVRPAMSPRRVNMLVLLVGVMVVSVMGISLLLLGAEPGPVARGDPSATVSPSDVAKDEPVVSPGAEPQVADPPKAEPVRQAEDASRLGEAPPSSASGPATGAASDARRAERAASTRSDSPKASREMPSQEPPSGEVRVAGISQAFLVAPSGDRVSISSSVQPGEYVLWASFGGEEAAPQLSLTVKAGHQLNVKCSAVLRQCRLQ